MQTHVSSHDASHPLRYLSDAWLALLETAKKVKHERFGQYAEEAMRFYDGPHNWMWSDEYSRKPGGGGFLDTNATVKKPTFQMTANRVFEAVALFGPALFHKYPQVLVEARKFPEIDPSTLGVDLSDPQLAGAFEVFMQQQQLQQASRVSHANIRKSFLNWLQVESGKKEEARKAITEAVIKGMGVMWTEMFEPPGSGIKYPRSRYVNVDDILVDPDAESPAEIRWIARRCIHLKKDVAKKFGIPLELMRAHLQSSYAQSTPEGRAAAKNGKKESPTLDTCEYWEIYSKDGFGDQLTSVTQAWRPMQFGDFGKFTRIVVAKGIPFPLNLPEWTLQQKPFEQLYMDVQWPIPFWADANSGGGWPLSTLAFYFKPGCVWPVSLIKPAIGELRFVNWCLSFLADKVAACSMDYIVALRSAAKEIEEQIRKGGTAGYKMLEIPESLIGSTGAKKVQDLITFLQAPPFHGDIWKMVEAMFEIIDRRTGITELLAGLGGAKQIRSAEEASIRNQNTQIRPDDMAEKTEQFLTDTVKKEMIAAQWFCSRQDVEPAIGPLAAWVWESQLQTQEFDSVVRDFAYTIEAGSARKPNLAHRQQGLQELGTVAMPTIQGMLEAGQPKLWNAFISQYCDTINVPADGFMVPEPDPNQPPPPSPEEQKAEVEMQKLQMEMQIEQQRFTLEEEKARLEMDVEVAKLELEAQKHQLELEFSAEEHEQEMEHTQEKSRVELKATKDKAQQQNRLASIKARQAAKQKPKSGSKT